MNKDIKLHFIKCFFYNSIFPVLLFLASLTPYFMFTSAYLLAFLGVYLLGYIILYLRLRSRHLSVVDDVVSLDGHPCDVEAHRFLHWKWLKLSYMNGPVRVSIEIPKTLMKNQDWDELKVIT